MNSTEQNTEHLPLDQQEVEGQNQNIVPEQVPVNDQSSPEPQVPQAIEEPEQAQALEEVAPEPQDLPAPVVAHKPIDKHVDYFAMSVEELFSEFKQLLENNQIAHINHSVRAIKDAFDANFKSIEESAESHIKEQFDSLWSIYRAEREKYAAQMVVEQKSNLEERLALIDELKELIEKEENSSIKEFHDIQNRWRKCGMVPREQSSAVWQTYQHHVERFFDYLKLNREFRDMEFERNLAEKNKIIARAEELITERSIKKAFEELQMLHKLWKEETGPVASDHRESVWERFSVATKALHERRHDFLKNQKDTLKANMEAKLALCVKIEEITAQGANSHDGWQKKMNEVEAIKAEFKKAGAVPDAKNVEVWERFKEVNRLFNQAKNNYYKDLKRSQMTNLEQKEVLVKRAKEIQESQDWSDTSAELKALQVQWKQVGHVPRQKSDELWTEFRAACNHFFDRLSDSKKNGDATQSANLEAKKEILTKVEVFEVSEDVTKSIDDLKALCSQWRALGRLPRSAKELEDKFNTLVDAYFEKLKINKKDVASMRYKDKIEEIVASGDKSKLYAEVDFIRRKIDEVQREVHQLTNNISFFSSSSSDNPMVREVNKKIEREQASVDALKEKLAYLRAVKM